MPARLATHPDSHATREPCGRRARGLTLIELAVCVAIVAVVASIAVPAYRSNIEVTERAEAQVEVRELEMKIERYFQIQGFYPETLAEVGADAPLDPWGNPYQYLRLQDPPPSSRARASAAAAAASARSAASNSNGGGGGGGGGTSASAGGSTSAGSASAGAASGGDAGGGRGGSAGARGAASASTTTGAATTTSGSAGGSSSAGGSAGGQARKDHNLVPINTDFDLYSMGPDGRTAPPLTAAMSRDDIVRGNNGRYIGDAANY